MLESILVETHHELSECLFADDTVPICASRLDKVIAARVFEEVTTEFVV